MGSACDGLSDYVGKVDEGNYSDYCPVDLELVKQINKDIEDDGSQYDANQYNVSKVVNEITGGRGGTKGGGLGGSCQNPCSPLNFNIVSWSTDEDCSSPDMVVKGNLSESRNKRQR